MAKTYILRDIDKHGDMWKALKSHVAMLDTSLKDYIYQKLRVVDALPGSTCDECDKAGYDAVWSTDTDGTNGRYVPYCSDHIDLAIELCEEKFAPNKWYK